MKNIYLKIFLLLLFGLQLYGPATLNAQCLCGGGISATPVSQTLTIPPTTVSTLTFNFQQFDPSIGNLSCVSFTDAVTGTSITGARNTGPDSTAFLFLLSLNTKIAGPGITITHPFTNTYGYDTLAPYGIPGDTITYGPADIITNPTDAVGTGGNAAYLGLGTVPFVYSVNGGMITLDGGSNYKTSVSTTIGGTLTLVYYYCPLSILATNMQNFSAAKKDNSIMLKWDAQNAGEADQFSIEYSANGTDFTDVGVVKANNTAASYAYNYPVTGNNNGYLYFRIKQTGSDNKTGYSSIQKVLLNNKTAMGITIRPNPAVTGMSLSFDHVLSGDYSIDLVNTAGQVVMNKKIKLTNSNIIPLNWSAKPASGIYFTRVTNSGTMEQQIIRVVIQ